MLLRKYQILSVWANAQFQKFGWSIGVRIYYMGGVKKTYDFYPQFVNKGFTPHPYPRRQIL